MRRISILALAAALAGSLTSVPVRAASASPVVVPMPAGAVTIQTCHWSGNDRHFTTNVKLADHTNLKIAKARLLLTFTSTEGETVSSYVDMTGDVIAQADGMPPVGTWRRSVFPRDLQTLRCGLVGVKFQGYPNVIYSAVK